MTEETFHGKLVAKRTGRYTVYVFQTDDKQYKMCTKLPNWGIYNINIDDTGFVTTQDFVAGEQYFNRNTNTTETARFTNVYFKEFIPDIQGDEEIKL